MSIGRSLLIALSVTLLLIAPFSVINRHPNEVEASEIRAEITEFRKQRDDFFKNHSRSPLKERDKTKFDHLNYYPMDFRYRFQGAIERYNIDIRNPNYYVTFLTNKGTKKRYVRYGQFTFLQDGKNHKLQIYKSILSDSLFIPFKDKTNGKETYSGGRYLDAEIVVPEYEATLDFNMAYNPSCAYNEKFICALAPEENALNTEIFAGEKKFR